ncbi:uncharacterized protein V1478_012709 [Vespula squamosa]|uniref:Uncharacterized protein n=1 Tax=Vespula squamosa TaxID=30214 RepID=A0ABD2A8T2_VESSQ
MYKKANKVVSTPIESEFPNSSLSISDIKQSSSDGVNQINTSGIKRIASDSSTNNKKIKRKRRVRKLYKRAAYYKKGRRLILSGTSNSEWETQSIDTHADKIKLLQTKETKNQQEIHYKLYETPERIRDAKYNDHNNFLLSPTLISLKSNDNSPIKDIIDKEDDLVFLDENKKEIDHISPILVRSNHVKKYPSAREKTLAKKLLVNKESGNWLVDVRVPTNSADLLWDKYITEHSDELSQDFRSANIYKADKKKTDTESDTDTDVGDILNILDRQKLKSKELSRIKGSFNKRTGLLTTNNDKIIYISDNESDPKSSKPKWRRGKWIKKKEKFMYSSSDSTDYEIQKQNGKLMSFNEFNTKLKMNRFNRDSNRRIKRSLSSRNKNHVCASLPSSSTMSKDNPKVKIKSMVSLKSIHYKRQSSGNYYITTIESSSS